jgi:regulator of replication initiation timing
MKITKQQLKQIIKEELSEAYYTTVDGEHTRTHRSDKEKEQRRRRKSAESDMSDLDKEIYVLKQLYGEEFQKLNDHMKMVGQDQGSFRKNVERMKEILSAQPNRETTLQAIDDILGTLAGWEPDTTPEM